MHVEIVLSKVIWYYSSGVFVAVGILIQFHEVSGVRKHGLSMLGFAIPIFQEMID